MTGRGVPDESRAARFLLKDYVSGRLLYCEAPPVLIAPKTSEKSQFSSEKSGFSTEKSGFSSGKSGFSSEKSGFSSEPNSKHVNNENDRIFSENQRIFREKNGENRFFSVFH